jgi:hypothetical protein
LAPRSSIAPRKLPHDEEFAIDAVARTYAGAWAAGEDPPDAYLTLSGERIAVEVSTLTQHVTDDRGTRPRLSDDTAAVALAEDLNRILQPAILDGTSVVLTLRTPIHKVRRTQAAVETEIRAYMARASDAPADKTIEINGNVIGLSYSRHGDMRFKKVSAAILHRSSSPDILSNARGILEDRIAVKARKCAPVARRGPVWLALLNDYWLSDAATYRQAFASLAVAHPFSKILLVSGDGSVVPLYEE